MTVDPNFCEFDPTAVPPPPEPVPPTEDDYSGAIQAHVDAIARMRRYESGLACTSYATSTVPAWVAEAAAFAAWRDAVWVYAQAELAKVQAGEREQPSIEQIVAELPEMTWPA